MIVKGQYAIGNHLICSVFNPSLQPLPLPSFLCFSRGSQTAEDWPHCCDWLLLIDMASGVEGTSTDVRAKISRSSSSHF